MIDSLALKRRRNCRLRHIVLHSHPETRTASSTCVFVMDVLSLQASLPSTLHISTFFLGRKKVDRRTKS